MNININTSKIQLETDRLILRAFCEDDLVDFYEYACVPGVGEMAGWPHHESIETSKRILQSFMTENEVFDLVLRESGKVIGSLGLHYSWANDDLKYVLLLRHLIRNTDMAFISDVERLYLSFTKSGTCMLKVSVTVFIIVSGGRSLRYMYR